jgi:tetratricopeptide (TPR) repeat protein
MGAASREEKLFDEACTALRKLHYNLAFDLFTEVMEIVPENPEVYYNRGLAAGHLLKWEEAEANFNMALRLKHDPDYLMHRALARLHLRHWEEALGDLDSVLVLESENELAKIHRQDLARFLDQAERDNEVPFCCTAWFDDRLAEFVGVDPEIVPKADREALRTYIAEALGPEGASGCDHTFAITEEWALATRRDPPGVCRFLFERGMRCDCDVLTEEDRKILPRSS